MKCIKKNKKIFIEKPAFIDFKSAENVNKEIKKKNLFFSEGLCTDFIHR
jgi:predicted dehydrogenase